MSSADFERCLKDCIDKNDQIVDQLMKLKEEMISYHTTCNSVRTAGTAVSAAGTGVLLASLAAIPLTGGLSLLGGASGLMMTVSGGATNVITDWMDSSKTKAIIKEVHDLVDSKQNLNNELEQHFDAIKDMEQKLADNDISREDSLLAIFRGIANGTIDKVDTSSGSPTLRLFTTLARLHRAEEVILKSYNISIKSLEVLEMLAPITEKALKSLGITARVTAHTAKTLGRISAGFSMIMTVVDIAILFKDWSSDHPTLEVIDNIIEKINEENKNLNEIYSLMDSLKERIYFTTIDEIPIVGANEPFNEVVVHLLNGRAFKCSELLSAYDFGFSFKDMLTSEQIALFLSSKTGAAHGFDSNQLKDVIEKQNKISGQSERVLVKTLLEKLKEHQRTEIESQRGSNSGKYVIDNKVVSIYRQIIDQFVEQTYDCSFIQFTRIPAQSVVYKDYNESLSDLIRCNIKEVMIAKIPSDFSYINSNAIIYDILMNILLESAKKQMMSLSNDDDSTEHSSRVGTTAYLINQFRIYVDECSLQYWLCHNGGDRQTFDETQASVQAMLQSLCEKMRVWVSEIRLYYPNRLYPVL